jgi:hypothetical protein
LSANVKFSVIILPKTTLTNQGYEKVGINAMSGRFKNEKVRKRQDIVGQK